jgi:Cupredoxin-like domain
MPQTFARYVGLPAVAIAYAAAVPTANAGEPLALTLKDHGFAPAQIRAPANERFRIEITNQDSTPAEFESSDLRAEKIIVPGGRITITAGPLKPGTYTFFDDYHPDTAKGTVIVTEQQAGK